jgi:DNA modification methylase
VLPITALSPGFKSCYPYRGRAAPEESETMASKPTLMTTTLWDFPSQQYGDEQQGDKNYKGATPAYILWNLLQRYTRPKDLVIDPMAGSGTTLDVARELGRRALGYDLQPTRPDIFRCDARKLPLQDGKASFVFIDPPYSTHLEYSDDPRCIGKLDAQNKEYYEAMELVIAEIDRVLRPGRHMALYVSDSFQKGKPFCPIGFDLFSMMRRRFEPVDIITVTRRNKNLEKGNWHAAAVEGNYFLRGFNYLFIMRKPEKSGAPVRPERKAERPELKPPQARNFSRPPRQGTPPARTPRQK